MMSDKDKLYDELLKCEYEAIAIMDDTTRDIILKIIRALKDFTEED